jgi:two-component system invasion response regulator UvrY
MAKSNPNGALKAWIPRNGNGSVSDLPFAARQSLSMDPATENSLRFLIISGWPIFALGIKEVISKSFKVHVHRVEKARDGLDLCATETFDLILVLVTRPDRSGLDLLPEFHKRRPNCRVIIVSLLAEEDFAARALKAGAAGYILQSSQEDEFVRAIKRVLDGGKYVSQEFAGRFAESFNATTERPHDSLSPREFEVFLRIAQGSTVKEIAGQLSLSVKTISTHHTHIFHKLKLRNDAELGEHALRSGLIA